MTNLSKPTLPTQARPAGPLSLLSALCVLVGTMNAFEFLNWGPLVHLLPLGLIGWLATTIFALRERQFWWMAASSALILGPFALWGSLYYSCYALHDCL